MSTAAVDGKQTVNEQIEELLEMRTHMLSIYTHLADLRPLTPKNPEVPSLLQDFCQSLVDYAAAAHFQLYQYFAEDRERRRNVIEVAERVYPRVAQTTDIIIAFNDKYDCEDHCSDFSHLEDDLSLLGEAFADRIDKEDEVIRAYRVRKGN